MTDAVPTEAEVASWDMEALLHHARAVLRDHRQDSDALIRCRGILMRSRFADLSPVLREVVMLSLAARDMDFMRKVIGWLEAAGDPAMGYYVHKAMSDEGDAGPVEDLLASAAAHGHFPAQRVLSDRKARASGAFAGMALALSRLRHAVRVWQVARRNPRDLRLK